MAIESGFSQDSKHSLGTEIIFVVEAMHGRKYFIRGKAGILNVGQLMSAFIDHLVVADNEPVLHGVVVELGSGIRVRHRNLDGFDVEFLGEGNGVIDGLRRFAGQTHDEVAVNDESELVAVFGELARTLDGGALLDVLQNLLIARFVADDEQTTSRFLHGLQSFEVSSHA